MSYRSLEHPQWGLMRLRARLTRQTERAGQQRSGTFSVPPQVMVLGSMISVQLGAALAESLFPAIGSGGTVFLRMGFAAVILLLLWRPRVRGLRWTDYAVVVMFGLTVAAMTACYYAAIARIPLGIATTLEFVGPLGVSIAASRRRLDLVWVGLAATGIILLTPIGKSALDPVGIVFALLAGAGWAGYILLNVRMGQAFAGGTGLALSLAVAALALIPFGIASGGSLLLNPHILLIGIGVAVLSTVIPFSLELEALRRVPARIFGILMSLEPAIAAIIGFIVLREAIQPRGLIALAFIVLASAGISFFQKNAAP